MSEKNETQVAIFEEIRKNTDIASQEQLNVPMSMVFGHGTVGDIESFGGGGSAGNGGSGIVVIRIDK